MTTHVGMLLYPGLTQLDLTGPFEVLKAVPDTDVHLVWKTLEPVFADSKLGLLPTITLDDRNRITGGGVTAGIDFALRLAAELAGEPVAKQIQLGIEYNPDPPFRSGHPDVADPEIVAAVRERFEGPLSERKAQIERLRNP